ncbi:MAG: alpha/beta hydrolase-fold protein [Myxococcota bacterium]
MHGCDPSRLLRRLVVVYVPGMLVRSSSVLVLMACGVTACRTPSAAAPTASGPFGSAAELESALAKVERGADPDPVWARIAAHGTIPVAFGPVAYFFYRGPGSTVEWRGDHNEWHGWDREGTRVGDSDLWRFTTQLLPGSRLDYKLVVDGQWILDPHNPHQQVGGFGPNSEARMSGWQASPYVTLGSSTPRGSFTADIAFQSERLGYVVNYRVHTPANLPAKARDLPTLYVTDGSDYYRDDMGAMVIVLDRLYEERLIPPMVVVFIDPWSTGRTENRREQELVPSSPTMCAFCDFMVEELIPTIEASYPVSPDPETRGVLGTSYGGLHATYMGLAYGAHFGRLGIQSPAYHPRHVRHVWEGVMKVDSFPSKVFLEVGLYESRYVYDSTRLVNHLEEIGVDIAFETAPEGHSWGHWRAYLDEALIHLYGASPQGPGPEPSDF